MGGLNLNIKWSDHRWAVFYCLVATIGALCYGYDVSEWIKDRRPQNKS
jgi:hypothetical protein